MKPGAAATFVAVAAVLFVPSRAMATGEVGRAVQDPLSRTSRLGVEQEISSFDLPIATGTRHTVAPRVDWAPLPVMSLRARGSYHSLWLRGGDRRTGLGDTELRLKARVVDIGGYILVQVGVIQTLPTGSASRGLGNGAMVLTPFVTGGRKFGRTIIYGYASDAVTLRNERALTYDDFTDPSTNHEARNAIGVITGVSSKLQANASLNATTILTANDFGNTFLYGAAICAYAPSDAFRVQLGAQLPLAGEKRFDWKGTFDVYFFM